MRDYWDRYIRDESHYQRVVDYIHQNPVKAGLCRSPAEWSWSSAGQTSGNAPGNADVPVGNGPTAGEDAGAPGKVGTPEDAGHPPRRLTTPLMQPGNTDVPVGQGEAADCTSGNADVLVGKRPGAGEDAGAPGKATAPSMVPRTLP
jgi:hypothetical protein